MGYFVDTYKTNVMENQSPESNAVVGILSPFLNIWEPGSSWDNGTKLGEDGKRLLDQNIFTCITMTQNRTPEQEVQAYLTDRQNQNWSALDGLGSYETAFKNLANAKTSLPDAIPADAETKKYSDKGNENGAWADETSSLGSMVELVNTVRGPHASGQSCQGLFSVHAPLPLEQRRIPRTGFKALCILKSHGGRRFSKRSYKRRLSGFPFSGVCSSGTV